MNIDGFEGHSMGEVTCHHGHPGYPEKDDVKACDQGRGGIVGLEITGRFIGPAHSGKWPES